MKNFKLTIEYDGTNYFGWQRQDGAKNVPTVQATIEKAIQRVFKSKISLIGAGRTDTGVHALGQVANFKVNTRLGSTEVQKAVNAYLPCDIFIKKVSFVPPEFHSRYSAKCKWYRYSLFTKSQHSVFDRFYVTRYPYRLNFSLMKKAAKMLKDKHDFSGIVRSKDTKNKVREIYKLSISKKDNFVFINVVGNGFLYKMVRRLVGILIDVGRNKLSLEDVNSLVSGNKSHLSIQTAPANGLMLVEVMY